MSYELWLDESEPVTGDTVAFNEGVYTGPHHNRRLLGTRKVVALITKESVSASQAVSFSMKVIRSEGVDALRADAALLRKASTLQRGGMKRLLWKNETERNEALARRRPPVARVRPAAFRAPVGRASLRCLND